MTQSLPDWLSCQANARGDVIAVDNGPNRLSYRELRLRALAVGAALRRVGVRPGDRVALLVEQGYAYAVCVHALIQAEAVLVPVNRRLASPEIAWQLQDAGVGILVFDAPLQAAAEQVVHGAAASGGSLRAASFEALAAETGEAPLSGRRHIDLSDLHAVIYTSGTTGRPKGTCITYGNHWWGANASALQLGLRADDRWLSPMPLFHVGGLAVLMRSLIYGTTAVLLDSFDPDATNTLLDSGEVDLVSLAPTMLERMLEHRTNGYPARLRALLLGGSTAAGPLLERCLALSVPVAPSYGLTEANSQVATLVPSEVRRKFGSSGRPLLTTEIAIMKDGRTLLPGEEGEIVVRGPTVTPGYLNRPDATAEVIVDGWLHTGDVGRTDDEGYLYVLDRRTDLIVSGAENVYPAEVESVLTAHEMVQEACVVAADNPRWGQVPVAYVVAARTGRRPSDAELEAFCRERLAGYKVPTRFSWVRELPRNASGKLLRKTVRGWRSE